VAGSSRHDRQPTLPSPATIILRQDSSTVRYSTTACLPEWVLHSLVILDDLLIMLPGERQQVFGVKLNWEQAHVKVNHSRSHVTYSSLQS